jgi:hypothetical protein
MTCKDLEQQFDAYLYGELSSSERDSLELHLKECTACQSELEQLRRLHALIKERSSPEVPAEWLVRCRQRLEEVIEREEHGWRRLLADWFSVAPGSFPSRLAAMLTLILFGFGLGWMLHSGASKVVPARSSQQTPQLASFLGGDLGHISSISQVSPDPESNKVRITLNAEHRVTLEGSLDDPHIRQILVDAVKSYNNPGIRLDTLDALKERTDNPMIQNALLYALQHDPNAGVRLEALRCVREMNWNPELQQALTEAVRRDANPGIRVAAADALVRHALSQHDRSLLPVLQNFAETDSNVYIRLKASAAVHELRDGP